MTQQAVNIADVSIPCGWNLVQPITGDASARSYKRIEKNGQCAVLMDCSKERTDRPGMPEFVKISEWLQAHGINAPKIYDVNEDQKYLILEDFGYTSFRKAIDGGTNISELYGLASDVLSHLRGVSDFPDLPRYSDSFIHEKHADVVRLFYSFKMKENEKDVQSIHILEQKYREVWSGIEGKLPDLPVGFVHGDYHLENMMFLPDQTGLDRLGLIDFQDAMIGPAPYDLANLLLDARRDVPQDIQDDILRGFDDDFMAWYRVLALQFHCRVIGLFSGFYMNDGRDTYMQHIPRLSHYIQTALQDELFRPLRVFFDDIDLGFG